MVDNLIWLSCYRVLGSIHGSFSFFNGKTSIYSRGKNPSLFEGYFSDFKTFPKTNWYENFPYFDLEIFPTSQIRIIHWLPIIFQKWKCGFISLRFMGHRLLIYRIAYSNLFFQKGAGYKREKDFHSRFHNEIKTGVILSLIYMLILYSSTDENDSFTLPKSPPRCKIKPISNSNSNSNDSRFCTLTW